MMDICCYIFVPDPENVHHQERALRSAMEFGWWWHVDVGSAVITNTMSGGDADNGGGCGVGTF